MKNIIFLLCSLVFFSACEHEIAEELGNETIPVVAFSEKLLTNAFVKDGAFHAITQVSDSAYYSVITTSGELSHKFSLSSLLPKEGIDTIQSIFFQQAANVSSLVFSFLTVEENTTVFTTQYYELDSENVPVLVCELKDSTIGNYAINLIGLIRTVDYIKLITTKTLEFDKGIESTQLRIDTYDNSGAFVRHKEAPSQPIHNIESYVFPSGRIILKNRNNITYQLAVFDAECELVNEIPLNFDEKLYGVLQVDTMFLLSIVDQSKTNFLKFTNKDFKPLWELELNYKNESFLPTNMLRMNDGFMVLGTRATSKIQENDLKNPSDFLTAELVLFSVNSQEAVELKSFDTDSKIFGNAIIRDSDDSMFFLASQFIFNAYTNILLIKANRNGDIID